MEIVWAVVVEGPEVRCLSITSLELVPAPYFECRTFRNFLILLNQHRYTFSIV